MSKGNRTRKNIRYWQFEGGYAQARELELRAVLEGYRLGLFRRNEVRVYAARLEHSARHPNARRLDLARILNCHSHLKGNRRLSQRQIDSAASKLDALLPIILDKQESRFQSEGRRGTRKPVARKVLQHIARGGATTVEALFYFAYFMTRIPPRAPRDRLMAREHYARIRYCDFQLWTGVHRATQSRLMPRIMAKGYLNSVEVRKRNENRYGQLFIDGPMTSLVRRQQVPRRSQQCLKASQATETHQREKRSTPTKEKVNAPRHKWSTLDNKNPKTEIEEHKSLVERLSSPISTPNMGAAFERIRLRAAQMAAEWRPQTA